MPRTKPKKADSTAAHAREWVALPTASIWQGSVVGRYPSGANAGYIDKIGADPSLVCVGVSRSNCGIVPAGHIATFASASIIDELIWPMTFPATLTTASRGALVYGVDVDNASLLAGDGPPIGQLWEVDGPTSGRVAVGPKYVAAALAELALGGGGSSAPTARATITTIAAFTYAAGVITAAALGAIGAQDTGVTLAAGDLVVLPLVTGGAGAGTVTALMTGPYVVIDPGGATAFKLARPPWYATGGIIPEDLTIKVGEGTIWGGNEWRAIPASAGLVIGTGDPGFWPKTWSAVASTGVAITTAWIRNVLRVVALPITAAHAFYASTLTAGQGTGAITLTGTAADQWNVTSINF